MNLKILSKHENIKSLLLNSTTSNLLCVCEQHESRLRKRRMREICGTCQFSHLHFYAPQAHVTFRMLNSCCWWTRTISNTRLHSNLINYTNLTFVLFQGSLTSEKHPFFKTNKNIFDTNQSLSTIHSFYEFLHHHFNEGC